MIKKCQTWINFAKDYQKDSYHIWWGKKKDKDLLMTLKKHSYLKICGVVKFLKFKKLSKIDIELKKFQKSFATHKWGKMYMLCWKKLHFIIQENIKM
jgi:hypothetical protein